MELNRFRQTRHEFNCLVPTEDNILFLFVCSNEIVEFVSVILYFYILAVFKGVALIVRKRGSTQFYPSGIIALQTPNVSIDSYLNAFPGSLRTKESP
jgi:hypothetical protein